MEMIPELDQEWRQAILPMAFGVMEGYEFTDQGLWESAGRLDSRGVPAWATRLRNCLLSWGSEQVEPWYPDFAIRSEAALVGIQLIASTDRERKRISQRLFARFVTEALRPFVDWVRQRNDQRQGGYRPLITLYERCERFTSPARVKEWNRLWVTFEDLVGYQQMEELFHAMDLGLDLLRELRAISYPETHRRWKSMGSTAVEGIVARLNRQHQWRLDGNAGKTFADGPNYTELVAAAFLIALEAECPTPDWLLG